MAERVGKVAVERERRVLDERVYSEMEALCRIAALGCAREGLVELIEVLDLDDQMKFAERG
jgi:hypothetical protein